MQADEKRQQVLNVISDEKLQERAAEMGNHLMTSLKELQVRYPIIGDVRGLGTLPCVKHPPRLYLLTLSTRVLGFFIGIELVLDRIKLTPAPQIVPPPPSTYNCSCFRGKRQAISQIGCVNLECW